MKTAARISVAVGIFAGIGVGIIAVLPRWLATPDATFAGRFTEDWVADLHSGNAGSSNAAVSMAATVIVPQLLDVVHRDTNDHRLKVFLVESLDALPGIHVEFIPADGRRALALKELAKLGPAGASAIPDLVGLLVLNGVDEQLIAGAATALTAVRCEPAVAVPALQHALVRPDGHGRPEVVEALGEYGPAARGAIPQLVHLLDDRGSKEIRVVVPRALKMIDPKQFSTLQVQ